MVISGNKKGNNKKKTIVNVIKKNYHTVIFFEVTGDCRDGWTKFQGSCYLFGSDQASWPEAEVNDNLIFIICFMDESQQKKIMKYKKHPLQRKNPR